MLVKEISKKYGDEYFTIWDNERIRKAFNFGHGTIADFKRYMNNNKAFCKFEVIEEDNYND